MESQHTPGPWEMEHQDWKGEPSPHRVYISGDKHESYDDDDENATVSWLSTAVCIVEGNATSRETTAANARLIAQAPAYHEWAERWLAGYSLRTLAEATTELRAIHAKAKEGTP